MEGGDTPSCGAVKREFRDATGDRRDGFVEVVPLSWTSLGTART